MIELPKKIYVDKSPIHGWGVFAKEIILKDELIEETPYVSIFKRGEEKLECNKNLLFDYRFAFPANINWEEQVIPFGCGCIYNHSDDANAYWETDVRMRDLSLVHNVLVHYLQQSSYVLYLSEHLLWSGRGACRARSPQ